MSTLYINSERIGSESYIGTREEWRVSMHETFLEWYKQFCDQENDEDVISFEEWVEETLDEDLREATEDEIARYPRLYD